MRDLDHKEDLAPKNWYFQTVVLEKTLESPLESKEIKQVNPKGNEPWIFTGRTDAVLILWPPDAKSWLIGKDPDAGKHWGQEEKGRDKGWDWDGNRQEGRGSSNRGNRWQCHTFFISSLSSRRNFFLLHTKLKGGFSMEMFFLSYVNETMYLLWNLPFFQMGPPKTNFFFSQTLGC